MMLSRPRAASRRADESVPAQLTEGLVAELPVQRSPLAAGLVAHVARGGAEGLLAAELSSFL